MNPVSEDETLDLIRLYVPFCHTLPTGKRKSVEGLVTKANSHSQFPRAMPQNAIRNSCNVEVPLEIGLLHKVPTPILGSRVSETGNEQFSVYTVYRC
jgi:hypothetical protein